MTLTNEEFYVDPAHPYEGQDWEQLKAKSIVLPASYYAKLKASLLKYCRESGKCPKGLEQKFQRFDEQVIERNKRVDMQ